MDMKVNTPRYPQPTPTITDILKVIALEIIEKGQSLSIDNNSQRVMTVSGITIIQVRLFINKFAEANSLIKVRELFNSLHK